MGRGKEGGTPKKECLLLSIQVGLRPIKKTMKPYFQAVNCSKT